MVIHTIGDSHSYNGWEGLQNVHTHHLGPKLCFSVGRDGINISDGYHINNGDTVVFCFGEIDCRCHIHKHISEHNDYKQIIDTIVTNYFTRIRHAVNQFNPLKTCIFNVVPPIERYNVVENPDYPYLGTDDERKAYVLYFNEKLQQKCVEYGFLFFDVYDHYSDNNGFLNKSLSDGNVHIHDGIYLKQFIEQHQLH